MSVRYGFEGWCGVLSEVVGGGNLVGAAAVVVGKGAVWWEGDGRWWRAREL